MHADAAAGGTSEGRQPTVDFHRAHVCHAYAGDRAPAQDRAISHANRAYEVFGRHNRFPSEIISHAVWLYHRFSLSFRDAEDLLAQRGITVTYETIRQWCLTFSPTYARTIRRCRGRLGDTWYLDEVFATIQGQRRYLWRAVDQDDDLLDILVQSRRDRRAAVRVFRKVLKGEAGCRAV